jgi:hypothetical protein
MPIPTLQCRLCGNHELVSILHLGDQALTGVFPASLDKPVTCGPLELVKCHGPNSCSLLQLRHSYEAGEMYGANYGYRSSQNQSMINHLRSKLGKLLSLFPVKAGDTVLDIGSNDGTLLSFYPDDLHRVGMDPSSAKFLEFYKPGIEVVTDFFSGAEFKKRFPGKTAKIVTSIAMFYDLEDPVAFAREVAEILDDEGVWHFEQSYMPAMLEINAYDTICHEHVEYYGLHQIKAITDRCGLKILDVELNDSNGASFAVTVAKQNSSHATNTLAVERLLEQEEAKGLATLEPYQAFAQRVFHHRDELVKVLSDLQNQGMKIMGYGASTKGNVILQFCGLTSEQIPCMAEVNADKFGKFTPGSHIPIRSEQDVHAMHPDYLLVMPWHFRKNIIDRERQFLARGGKLIFPLPEIQIVGA